MKNTVTAICVFLCLNVFSQISMEQKLTYSKVWGYCNFFLEGTTKSKRDWNEVLTKEIGRSNFAWNSDSLIKKVNIKIDKDWETELDLLIKGESEFIKKNLKGKAYTIYDFSWLKNNPYINEDSKKILGSIVAKYKGYKIKHADYKDFQAYKNPSFQKEITNPDEYLMGFIFAWNYFDYKNPYKYLLDHDWDLAFKNGIKLAEQKDSVSYQQAIVTIATHLQDDHAQVFYPNRPKREYYTPFLFKMIDSSLVVTDLKVHSSKFLPGDIIQSIGPFSSAEIIKFGEENFSWSKRSNMETGIFFVPGEMFELDSNTQIVVNREGQIISDFAQKISFKEISIMHYKPDSLVYQLQDSIYYLAIDNINSDNLQQSIEELKNATKLVIDCRGYPFESSNKMNQFLVRENETVIGFNSPLFYFPGIFYDEFFYSTYSKKKSKNDSLYPVHSAKVVLLVNEVSQSAGEWMIMDLMVMNDNVTIVGSPSSGAHGYATTVCLPGNYKMQYTAYNFHFPDGTQLQRLGVQPDIYVKPTIEDYKRNIDPLMFKAIEILNQ